MAIYIIGLLENTSERMVRLYNDKKNQYRDMKEKDVLFMLDEETIQIKNASIKNNKLVGTTGSLNKITNQNVYTVLGCIEDVDDNPFAYKMVDSNGKIFIIEVVDCIDFFKNNIVQNATIVDKKFVRGINWSIPCIEKKKEVKIQNKIIPFEITEKNSKFFMVHYFKDGILDIPSVFEKDGKKYCVTSIGDYALCEYGSLKGLKIPDSVVHIGEELINGEESCLEYIYFGANVQNIPNTLFGSHDDWVNYYHDLNKIEVSPKNKYYCSKNGVLFTKDMKTLIKYPSKKVDTYYKIPNSIITISNYAFYNLEYLEKIDLGDSLINIETCAFNLSPNIKDIIVPKTLKFIAKFAFDFTQLALCIRPQKTNICYKGTIEEWEMIRKEENWVAMVDSIPYCNINYNYKE